MWEATHGTQLLYCTVSLVPDSPICMTRIGSSGKCVVTTTLFSGPFLLLSAKLKEEKRDDCWVIAVEWFLNDIAGEGQRVQTFLQQALIGRVCLCWALSHLYSPPYKHRHKEVGWGEGRRERICKRMIHRTTWHKGQLFPTSFSSTESRIKMLSEWDIVAPNSGWAALPGN